MTGFSETPLPAFYSQKSERPLNGNFGYNPTLGVVPQLSLPDNLPELGNYATFDDNTTIEWTQQQMTSIAPSFAISTLPDINELSSNAPNVPPLEPSKTTGNVSFASTRVEVTRVRAMFYSFQYPLLQRLLLTCRQSFL